MAVMRDFLVEVGFQVDEPSAKRAVRRHAEVEKRITKTHLAAVDERVKAVEVGAAKIATAMTAAAVGITTAVNRAAAGFERLNYISKRSGSTPGKVTAFSYAMSQVGSSTDEANGSLQEFGQKLKTFPGFAMALERLGVKARGANGQLRDTAEIATDLGDALRKMQQHGGAFGRATALAQARVFGWEGQAADSLMDPRLRGFEDSREAQMAATGADASKATEAGVAFEQSFRHLQGVLDDNATAIQTTLMEKLRPVLDAFAKWMQEHGPQLQQYLTIFLDGFESITKSLNESKELWASLDTVGEGFKTLAKYLGTDSLPKYVKDSVTEFERLYHALERFVLWMQGKLAALGLAPQPTTPAGGSVSVGGGSVAHSGRVGLGQRLNMEPAYPFSPDEFKKATGATEDDYKAMRDGIADIEGSRYGQMGGSGGRYAGRYQFGPREIPETARSLGEPVPTTAQFLGDPAMQERYMQRYTLNHYRYLMRNPKFAALPLRDRLAILGYAHNQGAGGASSYLNSGIAGSDGNGTSGTVYIAAIRRRFLRSSTVAGTPATAPKLPRNAVSWTRSRDTGQMVPIDGQGRALNMDGSLTTLRNPLASPTVTNNTKGDTNVTHNPVFNVTSNAPIANTLEAARRSAGRGYADLLRNMKGQEQ